MKDQGDSSDKNRPSKAKDIPPAGPHDKPELVDNEKTPGSGALPPQDSKDIDAGTG